MRFTAFVLTPETKDLIKTQRICSVATADKDGKIRVSSRCSIYGIDEETLVSAAEDEVESERCPLIKDKS